MLKPIEPSKVYKPSETYIDTVQLDDDMTLDKILVLCDELGVKPEEVKFNVGSRCNGFDYSRDFIELEYRRENLDYKAQLKKYQEYKKKYDEYIVELNAWQKEQRIAQAWKMLQEEGVTI